MHVSTKKILLYSINYSPELTGIGKYNSEMVEWLVEQGYEVRVVTAPPYYPEWKIGKEYSAIRYQKEIINGAKVWRCPLWVPQKITGIKRLIHLTSFAISSFPVIVLQMFWKPSLIIVIEPPLAISPMAFLFSKIFRIKSWLHVQDLEVDAAFDLGILPDKKILKFFVLKLEGWLMKRFNIVSSISKSMNKRILSKGVSKDKMKSFPNWVDISQIYPLEEPVLTYRNQLGINDDDIVILYSGNMGEKQGLEILLDAAQVLIEYKNIRFILCGDGASKSKLMAVASQKGLHNVHFIPLQPKEQLNELLNTADIHALIQKKSASDLVMPSKLTGMFSSGRPIIATSGEETALSTVLHDANAGIVVPPEDLEKLTKAIIHLSQDKALRMIFGENARNYAVNHLSKDYIMKKFEIDFKEVTTKLNISKGGVSVNGR